jgi:hypothetical protein
MGSIAFSEKPENIWAVAGWALRQVLDDTASQQPHDSEMAEEFVRAKAVDGLMVYLLPPELAARITSGIKTATQGILSGAIRSGITDKAISDARTVAQYREALRELLEAIPSTDDATL